MRAPDGTAYDVTGAAEAPVVVLIHGLGLNRGQWVFNLPALTGFRVVTYDLLDHLTGQFQRLLDHLNLHRAALIGFSMGGMVARHFAQSHPSRVRALALPNTPHRRSPEAQAAVAARVSEAETQGPAAMLEAALARWFTAKFRAESPATIDLVRSWVLANDPAFYSRYYRIFADEVLRVVAPIRR